MFQSVYVFSLHALLGLVMLLKDLVDNKLDEIALQQSVTNRFLKELSKRAVCEGKRLPKTIHFIQFVASKHLFA